MSGTEITRDDLLKITDILTIRKYRVNNIVLFQGEVPPFVLFVHSGFVVSYTINNNGDEQIIAFFSVGDVLPVEWIFNRSPVSLYYYRAFTSCELIALPRENLLNQIEADKELANKLVSQFASSFIGATVHIHALEHSLSQEKLIKLLHYLVLRFGEQDRKKREIYKIPFKLTHAQIASMIGIARESVATEAVKLKKRGMLDYTNGFYTINLPALIASLGSEEFDNLTI
jgi:CRP/FNR family transcriptional regulator, cyclic AMP receptor protein